MSSRKKRIISIAILSALLFAIFIGAAHKGHHHDGEHPQSACSICLFQQSISSTVAPEANIILAVILVTAAVIFLYTGPITNSKRVSSIGARSPPHSAYSLN